MASCAGFGLPSIVPFHGLSAPSSVAVYSTWTFRSLASTWSMLAVTLLSLKVYVVVPLLLASDAGSYFDFVAFSFQVPANDSVACAVAAPGSAAARAKKLISATRRCVDIVPSQSRRYIGVEMRCMGDGAHAGWRSARRVRSRRIALRAVKEHDDRIGLPPGRCYGANPAAVHKAALSNILPSFITNRTVRTFEILSSGFASSTRRSARFPVSIVPRSLSTRMACAATAVAARSASMGEKPAFTYSSSSRYTL